jgi:gamma-glutamylcyclotransferase (GGCT)/AIG2-like uncharacterized protein YtfP
VAADDRTTVRVDRRRSAVRLRHAARRRGRPRDRRAVRAPRRARHRARHDVRAGRRLPPASSPTIAGVIHGELLTLTDLAAALPALDAYEGRRLHAHPGRDPPTAAGRGWAWIYVLVSSELAQGAPVIADGDWVTYRARGR